MLLTTQVRLRALAQQILNRGDIDYAIQCAQIAHSSKEQFLQFLINEMGFDKEEAQDIVDNNFDPNESTNDNEVPPELLQQLEQLK